MKTLINSPVYNYLTSSSESSPNTEGFCRIAFFDAPFFCGKISPYLTIIAK